MPYLQLDVPNHYPVEVKRGLARRLGDQYARIMQTTPELVTVAFRELGEGDLIQLLPARDLMIRTMLRQSGKGKANVVCRMLFFLGLPYSRSP